MEWEVSPRSALLTVLATCVRAGTGLGDHPVSILAVPISSALSSLACALGRAGLKVNAVPVSGSEASLSACLPSEALGGQRGA